MKASELLLELLYPPKCPFCGRILRDSWDGMCPECEKSLPYVKTAPQKGDFFASCASALYYEDDVRRALLRYKFGGCTGYAAVLGDMMAQCVRREYDGEYDLVTWVPLSRQRRFRRGYDQAQLLALEMSKRLGTGAAKTLKKLRNTRAQSATGSEEKRRANVAGAYVVPDRETVAGKRVLLADDIITTGATLSECARMLRMAGAAKVICVTAARSREYK